jgi:hypothetical protein
MTDKGNLPDLIDRLGAAAKDCRELLREMHSAQKALHADIKNARVVMKELDESATKAIDQNLMEIMNDRLEIMGAAFIGAMEDRSEEYTNRMHRDLTEFRRGIESDLQRVHTTLLGVRKTADEKGRDIEDKAMKVALVLEEVTRLTEQALEERKEELGKS